MPAIKTTSRRPSFGSDLKNEKWGAIVAFKVLIKTDDALM